MKTFRVGEVDQPWGITEGVSGSDQYNRKDNLLKEAGVDERFLEYFQAEFIGTGFDTPSGYCETGSVSRNQLW